MRRAAAWLAGLAALGALAGAYHYGGPDGRELARRVLEVLAPAVGP